MKTLKSMTDEELVVLYAQGDNTAFDVLLNRHKSSIHSYIYFIVRNKELTEDIFQETFVKVIMTIKQGRYTENGKFKAWITRIAHNLIIDNFPPCYIKIFNNIIQTLPSERGKINIHDYLWRANTSSIGIRKPLSACSMLTRISS